MIEKILIFLCYAPEDEAGLHLLKKHLKPLQRQGLIDVWYDRDIGAGKIREKEIQEHLDAAHLILLLISPDFINSDYCYGVEMQKALKMHDAGIARVIPIILRPVDWEEAPFSKLQVLPIGGQPIDSSYWHNLDEAFLSVVKSVKQAIKELSLNLQYLRNKPIEHIREGLLRGEALEVVLKPYPDIAEIVTVVMKTLSEAMREDLEVGATSTEVIDRMPGLHDLLLTIMRIMREDLEAGATIADVIDRIPGLHNLLAATIRVMLEDLDARGISEETLAEAIKKVPSLSSLLEAVYKFITPTFLG